MQQATICDTACMKKIDYPGTGNFSSFVYDGLGNRVSIVETRNNSVTSTQQFVSSDYQICEERDGSGALTKQFFTRGQTTGGTSNHYFYGRAHRRDVCSVTDAGGNDISEISYDAWGRPTAISGTFVPDFGYAGMYLHQSSGLNLTTYRAYSPVLARWLSRDPSGEASGLNLFTYTLNNPISGIDPLGLDIRVTYGQQDPVGGGGDLHTQICVNTRDDCCKITGWKCFSWEATAWTGGWGGRWYEDKKNTNNPIFEHKYKILNCGQDRFYLQFLQSLTQDPNNYNPQGPYDFFFNSHVMPSLMFNNLTTPIGNPQ
jgi:RHS repeat-associated protein